MRETETPTEKSGEDPTRLDAVGGSDAPTRLAADQGGEDSRELILGRYRLRKQLGSGGFGSVFSARDERLERDVAIKLLPRERVIYARFEREARAAARLQHPAIVTLYEAAVDDEGAYLVSELVRGKPLDRLLRDGKLSDREILEVVISLCDALEHAHARGVIHRDVKPSNVLVPSRRASSQHPAKLADFGVAHVLGSETLTRTGEVVGTLAYMAPEQADGREAGPAADLYSLAVVAYEALTGANPLRDRVTAGARRQRRTHFPPLRRQRRDLPKMLGASVDRALRPREAERGTVADLRAAAVEALPEAGDERGVVGPGWRLTPTELDDGAADPRWREEDPPSPPREDRRSAEVVAGRDPLGVGPPPVWLERGVLAAATGLSAAWLSTHLPAVHAPLAPAALALLVALATLLLQSLVGVVRPLILVAALPFGVVILGVVGLAGAWPALVGRVADGWLRRAIIAGGGLLWLAEVGALTHHDLYWRVGPLDRAIADGSLAAALVWAAAAALTPVLIQGRHPRLELALAVVGSALVVAGVQAFAPRPLHAATAGAVAGAAIAAWPALRALIGDLRHKAGNDVLIP
ncbi:MAG TPA: serine/threonine-protein kinase [Solirubrobacteraceae bacterium]